MPPSRSLAAPLGAILAAVAGLLALDALVFRTGLYTSILEPDSSTGTFELILRREQQAQPWYGRNLVVTLGDSRFGYYPRVANEQTATTGFAFRHAGVAGTDARAWYYMLRDLDPNQDGYRAIVIGVDDYDDEDGAYDIGDDLATMHYVAARLRFSDVIPFALSFGQPAARWEAFRGSLLKGTLFQRDILAFLSHPAKRIADVALTNRGYEEWTYGYVNTDRDVVGLKIDWTTLTATMPPGKTPEHDALRDQLDRFVLYRANPQTGKHAAFRRKWFGQLMDSYRGTATKVVFVRLPRGPIPRPDNLVHKKSSSIREFAARPGVLLLDEHAFDSLEQPELFRDAFHLNNAGNLRLSYAWHRRSATCWDAPCCLTPPNSSSSAVVLALLRRSESLRKYILLAASYYFYGSWNANSSPCCSP
jgi:hypothetical protein